MSTVPVALLDLSDATLHLAGPEHLVTACGLRLWHCTAGPFWSVVERAEGFCPECWDKAIG